MESPAPGPLETTPQTRQRLLEVAERLFADQGFAGTSVRDITAEAGANLAAINYHFGGKENLYREVFRRRLELERDRRLACVREVAERPDASAESVIRAFALAVLEPFVDVREGVRLAHLVLREFADARLEPDLCTRTFADYEIELCALLQRVLPGLGLDSARLGVFWLYGMLWQIVFAIKRAGETGCCPALGCSYEQAVDHAVRFTCAGLRAEALREPPAGF